MFGRVVGLLALLGAALDLPYLLPAVFTHQGTAVCTEYRTNLHGQMHALDAGLVHRQTFLIGLLTRNSAPLMPTVYIQSLGFSLQHVFDAPPSPPTHMHPPPPTPTSNPPHLPPLPPTQRLNRHSR